MPTTISKDQFDRIIYAYHWDPFQVLGYHEIEIEGKKSATVRAFYPEAKELWLIIDKKSLPMEKLTMMDV